ncbi:MAG TPA: type I methionyl aminopeptidase [Candidatus Binatia bacterium]|jgi:methionyl aminopeptidase|nr:type I methionyl aminopeptidase [Candidatus Binatia bacterium]
MIVLKSDEEIRHMREAGRITARVLQAMGEAARPGVSTAELNFLAERILEKHGAQPVFKGYTFGNGMPPFPATITACVNEELVHGIPGSRELRDGDLLTVDCGSLYEGYIGDAALSIPVGHVSIDVKTLLQVTETALEVGIDRARAGNRVGDISAAIQEYVEAQGFNVVRGYGGHGVGRTMHEDPHIPNYGPANRGAKLRPGMTFAIEPMVLQGKKDVITLDDHWTVVAKDGKLTAHCEHTIAVTENGPEILTLL